MFSDCEMWGLESISEPHIFVSMSSLLIKDFITPLSILKIVEKC